MTDPAQEPETVEPLIERARRLLKSATPGPWHAPGMGEVHSNHDAGVYARVTQDESGVTENDPVVADMCDEHDAVFIAACPGLIDELLSALAAETARREQAEDLARFAVNGWACYAKRDIEHREIARLHKALKELAGLEQA